MKRLSPSAAGNLESRLRGVCAMTVEHFGLDRHGSASGGVT